MSFSLLKTRPLILVSLVSAALLTTSLAPFKWNPITTCAHAADDEAYIYGGDDGSATGTKRAIVRYTYAAGLPGLVFIYAFSSWGWAKRDYWKWSNEGWFDHGTHFGGFDKLGHTYSHYMAMRLSCSVFNYTERGSPIRFVYAGLLTMLMGLSIEMGDAYSGYGFSYHDIIFDFAGMAVGGLLEAFPKADAFVSLSIQYWPSPYIRRHPRKFMLIFDDYGGMMIMANIKLAGFKAAGVDIPDFLRYVMIDVGYGTRGYTSFDRRDAMQKMRLPARSQDVYVGLSLNFVEVVKDFFDDPGRLSSRAVQQFFKYYHVPAGYSHRINAKKSMYIPCER